MRTVGQPSRATLEKSICMRAPVAAVSTRGNEALVTRVGSSLENMSKSQKQARYYLAIREMGSMPNNCSNFSLNRNS